VTVRVGLPLPVVAALAALAVPRAALHDLDLGGTGLTAALALGPPAVWIAVALVARVPRPLITLGAVGVAYGVLLAITHQVLWVEAFDGDPPRLGGNLADAPGWAHSVVTRGGAVVSSIVTGTLVGVAAGVVATLLARARPAVPR
jgi:hypothetical protein